MLKKLVCAVLMTVAMAWSSLGDLVTVQGPFSRPVLSGDQAETDFVSGVAGFDVLMLAKMEDNNGATTIDVSSVLTGKPYLFSTTTPLGNTADVNWVLTGSGYEIDYVLVKDGKAPGTVGAGSANIYYNLYEVINNQFVVGGDTVTIDGSKGISHISFFGRQFDQPGPPVPDGGMTLILLGGALFSLASVRRLVGK
jgi:hypothetical protein